MTIEKDIHQHTFRNEYQKAVINFIYTYNWMNEQMKQFFEPFDITSQQFNILRILRGAAAPLSTTFPARITMMSSASAFTTFRSWLMNR